MAHLGCIHRKAWLAAANSLERVANEAEQVDVDENGKGRWEL